MRMMSKFRITSKLVRDIRSNTFSELKKRARLDDAELKIGLPAKKMHKPMANGKKVKGAKPTPLALIGMVHEFGSTKRGIPERPWLRPGIRSGKEAYRQLNRINLIKVMRGQMTSKVALGQLGAMAVGMVQKFIRAGHFVALSEATVKRKGSSAPLIDTGQMIQSVVFEIGTKEKQE